VPLFEIYEIQVLPRDPKFFAILPTYLPIIAILGCHRQSLIVVQFQAAGRIGKKERRIHVFGGLMSVQEGGSVLCVGQFCAAKSKRTYPRLVTGVH
jgi:hypothetical protein